MHYAEIQHKYYMQYEQLRFWLLYFLKKVFFLTPLLYYIHENNSSLLTIKKKSGKMTSDSRESGTQVHNLLKSRYAVENLTLFL